MEPPNQPIKRKAAAVEATANNPAAKASKTASPPALGYLYDGTSVQMPTDASYSEHTELMKETLEQVIREGKERPDSTLCATTPFVLLIYRLFKRSANEDKMNYYGLMNWAVEICARELGMTEAEFMNTRGFSTCGVNKNKKPKVTYRKLYWILEEDGIDSAKVKSFKARIVDVVSQLDSPRANSKAKLQDHAEKVMARISDYCRSKSMAHAAVKEMILPLDRNYHGENESQFIKKWMDVVLKDSRHFTTFTQTLFKLIAHYPSSPVSDYKTSEHGQRFQTALDNPLKFKEWLHDVSGSFDMEEYEKVLCQKMTIISERLDALSTNPKLQEKERVKSEKQSLFDMVRYATLCDYNSLDSTKRELEAKKELDHMLAEKAKRAAAKSVQAAYSHSHWSAAILGKRQPSSQSETVLPDTDDPPIDPGPSHSDVPTLMQYFAEPSHTEPPVRDRILAVPCRVRPLTHEELLHENARKTEMYKSHYYGGAPQSVTDSLIYNAWREGCPTLRVDPSADEDDDLKKTIIFAQLSRMEVYHSFHLKKRKHRSDYGPVPDTGRTPFIELKQDMSTLRPGDFYLLRSDHKRFNETFVNGIEQAQLDFGKLAEGLMEHGEGQPSRDGSGLSGGRLDIGTTTQNWVDVETPGGSKINIPEFDGKDKFEQMFPNDHESLRRGLGTILDQLFESEALCRSIARDPEPYKPHPLEEALFTQPFRDYFFCKKTNKCLLTLQLKILSAGEKVEEHLDLNNGNKDPVTSVFSVIGKTEKLCNGEHILWSLKVIANSREIQKTAIYKNITLPPEVIENLNLYMARVDKSYDEFSSSHGSNYSADVRYTIENQLTAKTPWNLRLDDLVAYAVGNTDNGLPYCYVKLVAGIDRSVVMSNHGSVLIRVKQSVDMAVPDEVRRGLLWYYMGTYFGSPVHFFLGGNAMIRQDPQATAYDCCCKMKGLFGKSWKGGPLHRWQSCGLDYCDDFFKDTPENRKKQDTLIEISLDLIAWIEKNGDTCSMNAFREKVLATVALLHKFEYCKLLEIGEFRLVLFVQLLALTGWLKTGYGILERIYPVKGRGSYEHLVECCEQKGWEFDSSNMDLIMEFICLEMGFEYVNCGWAEGCLCEGKGNRAAYDVLMKGTDLLFVKRWDGNDKPCSLRIKPYGTKVWLTMKEWSSFGYNAALKVGV